MHEHHFVANTLVGGLASQRSRAVGLIIPTIANSIYT
jgi:DNA-binding LacI/PurR family transcriptional regulator